MSDAAARTLGVAVLALCGAAGAACKAMDLYRWWESRHPLV